MMFVSSMQTIPLTLVIFPNLLFAVPPPIAHMRETIDEITLHLADALKVCEEMALVAPEGQFKQCSTKALDALHYLNALFKGLDPITGSGHNIIVSDYMGSEHEEVKRRKRGSLQPFPNLKKAASSVRGDHTEEEEGEEMDIEAMVAETPSSGKEPIESPYGYNCYKVDIGDPKYHTKQNPPNNSWAPMSPQCYCGIQCKDEADFSHHRGEWHTGNANWKCSECHLLCQDKRAVWKHYRNFHLHVFIHMCQFVDCKSGFNQGVYGNDEQTPVWWHMDQVHHLPTPLGCPTCDKRFASPVSQKKTHKWQMWQVGAKEEEVQMS